MSEVRLSEARLEALRRCASMFRAKIDHVVGMDLEDDGLVIWHPGSGYEITESGRAALDPQTEARLPAVKGEDQ